MILKVRENLNFGCTENRTSAVGREKIRTKATSESVP